ncbi:ABC transporter permease [Aeromicrobium sp. CTD01-1L150]|uniref:ABC transporter permease n=1 Tax=Aeromicrobium sp. CTD01-1L150 TaxID=3341830 RepID=UPI0035C13F08
MSGTPTTSLPRFVAQRALLAVPVLAVIAVLTFTLSRLAPGTPATLMLGEGASEEQVRHLTERWGLDEPIYIQFGLWLRNLLQGDLGESIRFGGPVLEMIGQHIGPTISIALLGLLIVIVIGIPFGLLAGHFRGTVLDRGLMGSTFVGMSVPEFWLAMLLVLGGGVHLGWFPVSGYTSPGESITGWLMAIILPAIALSIDQVALVARMVRDSVVTTSNEPWVTSLRARGLASSSVVGRHQLKSALVTAITVIGNAFGGFITAAVVVEIVFNISGFGWLTVEAALQRDYPLLLGVVLVAAFAYVLVNLVVDALYAVIDPRIRA